ncbi:hypothetical protein ACQE98_02730 [Ornithinimicrobium sp. W1679]|uniref:hypothetical protein n=1 Tax=Ornithinimicrobium sp. W1679 TaxID=3418770 RepID=UPI003CE67FD0
MNTTSVEITAGMGGFLVLFGLMIAIWLLGRDLTRRLRRMRLREEERVAAVLRERAEAAEAPEGARRPEGARPTRPTGPAGTGSPVGGAERDPLA